MKKKTACVLGAGSWGTALAKVLADNDFKVTLWARNRERAKEVNEKRENLRYLPGFKLPGNIQAETDIQNAVMDTELIVSAVPSHAVRTVWEEVKKYLENVDDLIVVSATKGVEEGTLYRMSEVIEVVLGRNDNLAVLSGPSFAKEVMMSLPAAVTIASRDIKVAQKACEAFHNERFRTYANDDIVGVEVGGALKNVMAIAVGISDGLGFGLNTRAALITRGLHEIIKLGTAMGARAVTFAGLSGMGDLVLTSTGDLSRNRKVGLALASGRKLDEILKELGQVAEGVRTCKVAVAMAKKYNVDMPISEEVYNIIYKGKDPEQSVRDLMNREMKVELYFEG